MGFRHLSHLTSNSIIADPVEDVRCCGPPQPSELVLRSLTLSRVCCVRPRRPTRCFGAHPHYPQPSCHEEDALGSPPQTLSRSCCYLVIGPRIWCNRPT